MRTAAAAAALALVHAGSGFPDSAFARAQAKLTTMQLSDKLGLLRGYSSGDYAGDVPSIAGLPPINLQDGPQGVAGKQCVLLVNANGQLLARGAVILNVKHPTFPAVQMA